MHRRFVFLNDARRVNVVITRAASSVSSMGKRGGGRDERSSLG